MMKYKLNKQAEAINLLLNNAIQNTKRFQNNSTSDNPEMYAQIMDKLGLLPDGIELSSSNATYLTDKMFGNSLWIYAYPYQYGMGYEFSRHGDKKEICRNLLNVYKANSSELYYVVSDRYYPVMLIAKKGIIASAVYPLTISTCFATNVPKIPPSAAFMQPGNKITGKQNPGLAVAQHKNTGIKKTFFHLI